MNPLGALLSGGEGGLSLDTSSTASGGYATGYTGSSNFNPPTLQSNAAVFGFIGVVVFLIVKASK